MNRLFKISLAGCFLAFSCILPFQSAAQAAVDPILLRFHPDDAVVLYDDGTPAPGTTAHAPTEESALCGL